MARNGICVEVLCYAVFLMTKADCEPLDGYQFRVYTTNICPRNQAERENRLSALHCTDFNAYMCVPNENFTELLEFCYSSYKISIQSGVCLFLTKRNSVVDIYDCRQFTSGCPDFPYFSDEMYKHQNCARIKEGCFLAEPSCSSKRSTSFISTAIFTSNNNIKTENNYQSDSTIRLNVVTKQQSTTHSNNATNFEKKYLPVKLGIVVAVLVVFSLILILSVIICKTKLRFLCGYRALNVTETGKKVYALLAGQDKD